MGEPPQRRSPDVANRQAVIFAVVGRAALGRPERRPAARPVRPGLERRARSQPLHSCTASIIAVPDEHCVAQCMASQSSRDGEAQSPNPSVGRQPCREREDNVSR